MATNTIRNTIQKKNLTWTQKLSDQLNLAHGLLFVCLSDFSLLTDCSAWNESWINQPLVIRSAQSPRTHRLEVPRVWRATTGDRTQGRIMALRGPRPKNLFFRETKWLHTPCPEKNGPPKHVKITLLIENVSEYFFVSWKAIYLQCLCAISRQLAYPLLKYNFL